MVARTSVALVVAASLAGCGEKQVERCGRARTAAIAAVTEYRDDLEPAAREAREAAVHLAETKLESAELWRKIASHEPLRELELHKSVQPSPNLTELTPTNTLESIVGQCDDLAKQQGVSEATVKELGSSCPALEALRARFDAEIPAAKRRKGARWTAAQKRYLDAVSSARTRVASAQQKAIGEYESAVRAELEALRNRGRDPTLARCDGLISALEAGETGALDGLQSDPTFPARAVLAVSKECEP